MKGPSVESRRDHKSLVSLGLFGSLWVSLGLFGSLWALSVTFCLSMFLIVFLCFLLSFYVFLFHPFPCFSLQEIAKDRTAKTTAEAAWKSTNWLSKTMIDPTMLLISPGASSVCQKNLALCHTFMHISETFLPCAWAALQQARLDQHCFHTFHAMLNDVE